MIVLGIDAGASKTHAVLADQEGRVLGAGTAGGANWEIAGLDGAREALGFAVRQAIAAAGIRREGIAASGVGIAGLDWPNDEARLQPVLASAGIAEPCVLVNDAFLILRAGTEDGVGLGIIAGSGSIVVGRNRRGRTERSLGAGYPFTDWGGSGDIAAAAVHAVACSYMELGPHTVLTGRMLTATGCRDVSDLLESIMRWKVQISGDFAPEVFQAADEGDPAARSIVARVGKTLGENAVVVARRLEMLDEAFPIVTSGGIFSSRSSLLNTSLLETLRSSASRSELVHWSHPPVVGALLLALDLKTPQHVPDVGALADRVRDALNEIAGKS